MLHTLVPPNNSRREKLLLGAATHYAAASKKLSKNNAVRSARRITSYGITAALLAISIFGGAQLAHVGSSEIPHHTTPATTKKVEEHATPKATSSTSNQVAHLAASEPNRIQIPAINLDATVESVGLDANGVLQVPDRWIAGWYNGSPTPGEIGPAVIDGHVDSIYGTAVFFYLKNLKPSDKIMISRNDGSVVTFNVEKIDSYDQNNFPTQTVYGNINYPGLRLITCDGTFNYETRHYSNNLVVYARMVNGP
jgi:sortase (surface protein transpeptidase)